MKHHMNHQNAATALAKGFYGGALAILLGLFAASAQAQNTLVGFVKTVAPQAEVVIDGNVSKMDVGMPLHKGFRVRTGPQGSLGLTFSDNTMLSFGPNSEFVVDEYLYAPAKDELRLDISMLRGTMQYVSGMIAKLKPDAVAIKTPKGVIGVRGTRFALTLEEDGS